jgi:hypothetical protein
MYHILYYLSREKSIEKSIVSSRLTELLTLDYTERRGEEVEIRQKFNNSKYATNGR